MDKIDTQGMSGGTVKGCMDNVYPRDPETGEPIYPPANFKVWPIFDDKERAELKEIMLEALKEYHEKPNYSPYRLDELQE
tara:strand:+ start:224 stop:463 length:240 start_codon:yes stop_codon:yes gene_type:complete